MTGLFRDLLHAARSLFTARAFTFVCVTSLGLGMAVVIGLLVFMRLVLGTPPGIDGKGLAEVVVRASGQLRAQTGGPIVDRLSYADYLDIRDAARGMTISGSSRGDGLVRFDGQATSTPIETMYVSSNYFATVGVALPLGRGLTPVDDRSQAEPEAVISHRMWTLHFGRDPSVIGRRLNINRTDHLIVGVAPDRFRGHMGGLNEPHYQMWLPLSRHPRLASAENARLDRSARWVRVHARLPHGTSFEQGESSIQAAVATIAPHHGPASQDMSGGLEPYYPAGARLRAQIQRASMILFGLSGIVLLVVGLNISGMMLVRSAIREREIAIRGALGASRARLVRYHLGEAFVMALMGGAFASLLLFAGPIGIAWAFNAWGLWLDVFRPDAWLALQCVALCFVTSLVLGLLPALRFSRPSILALLKNDSAGKGRRVGRLQRLTAAAQAGIAVPFLVICGVQFDLARVTAFADVGFTPHGMYAANVNLAAITRTEEERQIFLRTAQESLRQAGSVTAASAGDGVPLDFIYRNTRVARDGGQDFVGAHATRIAPGYFEAIGTKLLTGRAIDATDRAGGERVVLLSEPLARDLFPDRNPLGQRVQFDLAGGERLTHTVVGVTADLVSTQMGNPRPQLFVALAQHPAANVMLIARGNPGDPSVRAAFDNAIAGGLRAISAPAEAADVFRELITGEGQIEASRSDLLTSSGAGGAAAAVALVLAGLGVYGVIAFMVATRTREIGVRLALGASRTRVVRDVLTDALKLVVPGVAVGLLLSVAWVRMVDPAWYPLGAVEPLVYSLAAGTSLAIAALAGVPSARRAAAIQPLQAMRTE